MSVICARKIFRTFSSFPAVDEGPDPAWEGSYILNTFDKKQSNLRLLTAAVFCYCQYTCLYVYIVSQKCANSGFINRFLFMRKLQQMTVYEPVCTCRWRGTVLLQRTQLSLVQRRQLTDDLANIRRQLNASTTDIGDVSTGIDDVTAITTKLLTSAQAARDNVTMTTPDTVDLSSVRHNVTQLEVFTTSLDNQVPTDIFCLNMNRWRTAALWSS